MAFCLSCPQSISQVTSTGRGRTVDCPLDGSPSFIVSGPMTGAVTFLDEYRASRASGTSAEAGVAVLREWLTLRADAVLEDLRAHDPEFALPGLAFITSYDDVREVLSRSDVFSVAPYGEAMTRINRGPSFLLGMDDGPEYRRQLERLGSAFQPRRRGSRARTRRHPRRPKR